MSVYNGEDYLAEAIESVLNQTFKDFELIVINDCSTDSTGEILNRFAELDKRVKVHTNEVNLRLPSSLNKAISYAQGKYIARMDADDICLPERLEKQYKFMENNPNVALSSCRFMTLKNGVISSGGCGGKSDNESIKALLLVTNPILHPGIIAKADAIRSLWYDKNFTCTEDMELWTRFVMAGYDIEIMPEYLMIYRLHDKQITETTMEKQHKEVIAIQKNYYGALLETMNSEQEEFYIRGIYFRENKDIGRFCEFYKWLKAVNRKTKAFSKDALNYAMFEILAEYKRKGISKKELIKAMLMFGIPFLVKEIPDRKKRAHADGLKCVESAKKIGLTHSGGSLEFPTFSK
jgi:glycosyltransferase involved in cell wall biosynthesis